MKLNRLETHDRLIYLKQNQSKTVQQGAEDCLKKNFDSVWFQDRCHYIYIFGHARTTDDGLNKRLLWQSRLSKPKMEPNSYLFRAQSKSDMMEICWILPPMETWNQYKKGNVVEHRDIIWSIDQYKTNREKMSQPYPDDLSDHIAKQLLLELATEKEQEAKRKKMMDSMYKPVIEENNDGK